MRSALEQALDLAAAPRAQFLQQLRLQDAALAAAVASALLASEDDDPAFEPLLVAPPLAESTAPPAAGDRLGPWRLCELLGTGGMGEVWLAERADGAYQQRVAIKLPRRGMQSAAAIARFERERNLLAELELPGIARLVDGGWSGPGQPWLAMEYVQGQRIDAFAAEQRLGVRDRVRLLRDASRTLAAAHNCRIVHRDLKPQNLLVRADGSVVLVDFGIAAALGEAGQGLASHLATPKYAAPEQLRGEPASAAADVYSLALLGRELLPEADADLAAVLAAATATDAASRTATAAALADELDRWLAAQPVLARPASLRHRARLLARRDPRAALLLAISAVAVFGLLATSLYFWQRERLERQRADAAWQAEALQHAQVRTLVADLIGGVHDRVRSLPGAVPVRNFILERAEQHLAALLPRAPGDAAVAAEVLGVQLRLAEVRGARTYGHQGDTEGAMAALAAALELADAWASKQAENPAWQHGAATALRLRGDLHRHRGALAAAREDYGQASQRLDRIANQDLRRERAVLQLQLGKIEVLQGNLEAGLAGIQAAAESFEALLQEGELQETVRRDLAHAYAEIGYASTSLGDPSRTTAAFGRALLALAHLTEAHPHDQQLRRDRIEIELELALDHGQAGRRAEALATHAAAVTAARALSAADPDNVLSTQLLDRALLRGGRLHSFLGEHELAAAAYREVEPRLRAAAEQPFADAASMRDAAEALVGRAEAQRRLGQHEEAQAAYVAALHWLNPEQALRRGDHLAGNLISVAWLGLANLALDAQQAAAARQLLEDALPQATAWAQRFDRLHWPLRHLAAMEHALGTACEALAGQFAKESGDRDHWLGAAANAFQRGMAVAEQLQRGQRLHGAEKAMPRFFAADLARIHALQQR